MVEAGGMNVCQGLRQLSREPPLADWIMGNVIPQIRAQVHRAGQLPEQHERSLLGALSGGKHFRTTDTGLSQRNEDAHLTNRARDEAESCPPVEQTLLPGDAELSLQIGAHGRRALAQSHARDLPAWVTTNDY